MSRTRRNAAPIAIAALSPGPREGLVRDNRRGSLTGIALCGSILIVSVTSPGPETEALGVATWYRPDSTGAVLDAVDVSVV
jgi:hypothetical protein